MGKWDVVMMSETWLDGKDWKSIKLLSKGYVWRMQGANKEQVEGKGMGGMVSGVRRELMAEEKSDREGEEKEGCSEGIRTTKKWTRKVGG